MEASTIKATVIFLLLLQAGVVYGANLCDAECRLTITFPSGGQIDAIEPLTITFGDSGLVDTAGSVTAYLDGETLALNAGDSLSFGNGGSFDIGSPGNIDYSNLSITTDGEITLTAVGGGEKIQIPDAGKLSIINASFTIHSSFNSSGTLELSSAEIHIPDAGAPAPSGCDVEASSGVTLSSTGVNPLVIDNSADCNTIFVQVSTAPVYFDGSLSVVDTQTNTIAGSLTLNNPGIINGAGPLTSSENDEVDNNNGDGGALSSGAYFQLLLVIILFFRHMRLARPSTDFL